MALLPLATLAAFAELAAAAAVFRMIQIVSTGGDARLPGSLVSGAAWLAALLLAKNLLLALSAWTQSHLIAASLRESFRLLLTGYLAAPWSFHRQRRSADFIHDVTTGIDVAYRLVLSSAVGLASEAMVALALAMVLLAHVPGAISVVLVALALSLGALVAAVRRRVAHWGQEVHEAGGAVRHRLQETLAAIREIQSFQKEEAFTSATMSHQARLARAVGRHLTALAAPRLVTESLFVIVALAIVLVLLHDAADRSTPVLPLLGLFMYTGFRLIPAANRVVYFYDHLRHGQHAVTRLSATSHDLHGFALSRPAGPSSFRERIELRHVSAVHGSTTLLRDVTLTIAKGECIGLVGPSGSGKTTLLDLIAGLVEPTSGSVTIDGQNATACLRSSPRLVAYVQQAPVLLDDTLAHNVAFGIADAAVDADRLDSAIERAQLDTLRRQIPDRSQETLGESGARVSGGERQRIAVARALYPRPEILLLDEPTASVDTETQSRIADVIASLAGECTIVIAAHRAEILQGCTRVFHLEGGTLTERQ